MREYENYLSNHNNWYALYVLTGREDYMRNMLERRLENDRVSNLRIVVPKRKLRERKHGEWSDVVRVLFPGYILINGSIGTDEYYWIKDTLGVVKLLRYGQEIIHIEPNEINIIAHLIGNDEIIGYSKVFVEGGFIRVIDGPLLSMEGYIQSIDHRKGRAKVKLDFLGKYMTVDLGINMINTIN